MTAKQLVVSQVINGFSHLEESEIFVIPSLKKLKYDGYVLKCPKILRKSEDWYFMKT